LSDIEKATQTRRTAGVVNARAPIGNDRKLLKIDCRDGALDIQKAATTKKEI